MVLKRENSHMGKLKLSQTETLFLYKLAANLFDNHDKERMI